jgi:flagellar basal body rod protein FlgG
MTRMIEIQRLYEANQKVIQTHDELLAWRSTRSAGALRKFE